MDETTPVRKVDLNDIDFDSFLTILSEKMGSWFASAVAALPNLLAAAVVVLAFYLLGKVLRNLTLKVLYRISANQTMNDLVAIVTQVITVMVGFFVALGILNLEKTVTSLLTGAGIITLALGFAFQDIASNFLAGVIIAFRKPYKVGDVIEIDQQFGVVQKIELRMTMMRTFDGLDIFVPNKLMLTKLLTNYTFSPLRRVSVPVNIAYHADLSFVEKTAYKALGDMELVDKSKPVEIYFKEFSDYALRMEAQFWIEYHTNRDYNVARHEAILRLKAAFTQYGIEIPVPIRHIHVSEHKQPEA